MARIKLISDDEVLDKVLAALLADGEKSVTFASVAKLCGLAPSTLVQRYSTCAAMVQAALHHAWDRLEAQTEVATATASTSGKGVQALLKALAGPINTPALLTASLRHPVLTARSKTWRETVEQGLVARLGHGPKAAETAALIFAAWQGRMLWDAAGGKGFRLGEALKRLG